MTSPGANQWNGGISESVPKDYAGANLQDYETFVTTFSWAQEQTLLDGLPQGGLNIAHEAVDRHVLAGRGGKLALRWIGRDNRVHDFSYADLQAAANRFRQCLGAVRRRQRRARVLAAR